MQLCRLIAFPVSALLLAGLLAAQPEARTYGTHLGVNLLDVSADRANAIKLGEPRGVEVKNVQQGSPAEAAGLRAGDVLLTYNDEDILSAPQLGRLVGETPPGRKVKIQYWREGKVKNTVVAPALAEPKMPDASSPILDARALNVPDFPRMLMLWDNLALGIECEPIDSQIAQFFGVQSGILIRQVAHGMIGDRAGLRAGDVITSVDTRMVTAPKDLISYLRTRNQPDKALVIQIVRDHKPRSLAISLSE
jgi:serine protease Do